jgi:hypothetical protein
VDVSDLEGIADVLLFGKTMIDPTIVIAAGCESRGRPKPETAYKFLYPMISVYAYHIV